MMEAESGGKMRTATIAFLRKVLRHLKLSALHVVAQ